MSENTLPFGGTAVAERPAPAQPEVEDSLAGDNRKKLLYALVGVGVLVLAVVAFFLLKSGGSSNPAAGGLVPTHHVPVTGAAAAAPVAAAPVTLPRKVAAPEGRDPFKPLYTPPTAAAAPTSTTGSTGATPSVPAAVPGSTGSTTSAGSTSNGAASTATTHPVWIQLRAVTASTATFYVGYSNGKTLTVRRFLDVKAPKSGSRTIFGSSFALLGISSGKVALQYGDGSPFILDMTHDYMVVN